MADPATSHVSESELGLSNDRQSSDKASRRLKVSALSSLDEGTLGRLISKKIEAQSKVTRQFAESAIPEGIYEEDGQTYWVCPNSFFEEDCYIGMMVAEFAQICGAKIKLIKDEALISSAYNEQFLLGIWFGIQSSTNQRRSRAKKDYELGRTCVFSLIVKNVFLDTPELGIKALDKDHFFFGNNPGESVKKEKVPFYIKMKLRSFFAEARWGDFLFGLINKACQSTCFVHLTESEQDKVVEYNINPLDKLITSKYPVTDLLNKKGHKVGEEVKKPKVIRSSPLYKKYEMDLIHLIIAPLFNDLTDLNSQYKEIVLSDSYASVEKRIESSIKVRRDVLARFANRTKMRLQDIRMYANDQTIRKAKVTLNHQELLLNNIADPATSLVNDIFYIIGNIGSPKDLISYATKKRLESTVDARGYLYKLALEAYLKHLPREHRLVTAVRPASTVVDPIQHDHESAIKAFMKLPNCIGQLKKNSLGLRRIKAFKLFGRSDQLRLNTSSIVHTIAELQAKDKYSVDLAATLASNGTFIDSHSALTHYVGHTRKELEYVLTALSRVIEETREDAARKAASDAKEAITADYQRLAAIVSKQEE